MNINNFDNFLQISGDFEKNLEKEYKKSKGIYYTDVRLSYKIIEFLKLDPTKSFYKPNCGSGSFIYAAKYYGFEKLYGADIDKTMTSICRKMTGLKANQIKTLDTIGNSSHVILKKFGVQEKFDYIVGNPPYVPLTQNIKIKSDDYFF